MREQYGSLWEIARSSVKYLFTNYKRLFKFAIYSVYMFLFFKRFVYVLRYFSELGVMCMKSYFSLIKRILKFVLMAPKTGLQTLISSLDIGIMGSLGAMLAQLSSLFTWKASKNKPTTMKRAFFFLFGKLFKVLSILYNAFILVQLSCIGYAESFRIKRAVTHVLNQNKQIRVIDRTIEQPPQFKT